MGEGYLNNKKITPKKSLVIGILVGGIVFGTAVGVGAVTYFSASQVSFTPTNANWNVTNVEEAVDSLYSIASRPSSVAIKLGSGAQTYDVSSVYSDYANLTTDNFVATTSMRVGWSTYGNKITVTQSGYKWSGYVPTATISYNNETGILNIETSSIGSLISYTGASQASAASTIGDVWLIVP